MIPLKVLIDQLWDESNPSKRCPFLEREDDEGCCCNSPKQFQPLPIGHLDLQMWCLEGADRHVACIFHPDYGQSESDKEDS